MKDLRIFFAIVLLFGVNTKIFSQDADEIVNKYITAIGGIEKIHAINTMKVTGKFAGGGMEVPFTQTYKRPLMSMMEATIQGMTMKQAFDGTQGWMINPFMGKKDPDVMPKDQEKMTKRSADFDGQLVDYKDKGSKIELIGKEDYEGSQVFNIKLVDKNGDVSNYFIDADSFLLLKQSDKMTFESKEITAETVVSNYKQVEGVMMPFSIEVSSPANPMGSQKITMEKIEVNIPIEDSYFKMPASK